MKVEYSSNMLKAFGSVKDVVSKKADSPLKILMSNIATQIISQLKNSLAEEGSPSGSLLSQSIAEGPLIIENDNSINIQITANDYWDYINSGVNAAPPPVGVKKDGSPYKQPRRPVSGSPYSFKNLGVSKKMALSLQGWMPSKGIGNAANYKSLSYALGRKVKLEGIEPNHFVDKVLTPEFIEEISVTLSEEIGKQVILSINNNLE